MRNTTDILSLTDEQLSESLISLGFQKYRAKQVSDWLWKHAVRSFDLMTNLSKENRQLLSEKFFIPAITLDTHQISMDGTVKFRFKLHDGKMIESVLIPVDEKDRYTVCVSSQAGCSLTCSFCATGKMGLLRQLTASEIFDQYVLVNQYCLERYEKKLSNIVFMGMGEPLLNYKNVLHSISRLTSDKGPNLSSRRITISTAGISKMIKKLADDNKGINLALSLHAANDEKRVEMMPINESNNLSSLMDALTYYSKNSSGKISYEYIAFEHFNDTAADAKNLIRLCSRFHVTVNIIEYNPVKGVEYEKSSEDRINSFAKQVRDHGIMITVRKSRGKDIDAACGQLANKS
ncbi:MAG: 23S rRNA (adenine(2503)-C(2))-methyltransferase RlmN [Saprospiraceae bacterium]|nr:23S rRNA (adenine(2503)-C(2))-methyltransferase RlmN [Saprospiraceae bacterium]